MKKKITYTDEPIDNVKVITDFLPSPEELVFYGRNCQSNNFIEQVQRGIF